MLRNKLPKPSSSKQYLFVIAVLGQDSACDLAGSSAQGLPSLQNQDTGWAVVSFGGLNGKGLLPDVLRLLADTIYLGWKD